MGQVDLRIQLADALYSTLSNQLAIICDVFGQAFGMAVVISITWSGMDRLQPSKSRRYFDHSLADHDSDRI